jgi:cytoskeletal protein CcmA (bactofilin family)
MTTIGRTFHLTGDITSDEDLLIEGRVSGHVTMRGGALTIGEQGQLDAEIQGARVQVHGALTGSVVATERIELAASASVQGSLSANQVVMVDGATFNGSIDMDKRTIAAKVAQHKAAQPA